MEQLVKPSLLAIPGINTVTHRAKARKKELDGVQRAIDAPKQYLPNRLALTEVS